MPNKGFLLVIHTISFVKPFLGIILVARDATAFRCFRFVLKESKYGIYNLIGVIVDNLIVNQNNRIPSPFLVVSQQSSLPSCQLTSGHTLSKGGFEDSLRSFGFVKTNLNDSPECLFLHEQHEGKPDHAPQGE